MILKKPWLLFLVFVTPVSAYLQQEVQLFRYLEQSENTKISILLKLTEIPGSAFKEASFLIDGLGDEQDGYAECYAISKDSLLYLRGDTLNIQKSKPSGYIMEKQILISNTSTLPFLINRKEIVFQRKPDSEAFLEEIIIVQSAINPPREICSGLSMSDLKSASTSHISNNHADTIGIDTLDLKNLEEESHTITYQTEQDPDCSEPLDEPVFPGGEAALYLFITENTTYSSEMSDSLITGIVYVQFVIEKDGIVSNIEVKKGIHEAYNREAIRIISIMPIWKPGINVCGKPMRVKYIIPVKFQKV